MKMRIIFFALMLTTMLFYRPNLSAQIKYESGKLTIGNVAPYSFYSVTAAVTGMYINTSNGRFFQIDCAANGAPRIAGHNNQVVFYNTQTGTFNSIQVNKVLNYSDERAKTGIKSFNNGLEVIKRLSPVSYNFSGQESRMVHTNLYTDGNAEIGLLAQELETVLPNLVFTDDEGRKLVDYVALIPVLIDAVKSLQEEIEVLKKQQ